MLSPAPETARSVVAAWPASAPIDSRPPRQADRPGADGTKKREEPLSLLSIEMGGDTRPLLDIIQARIDAVTPLVHRSSGPCKFLRGTARVSFRMNRNGYHRDHRLLRTSGHACLDEKIEEVLHLAEPYPYLPGRIAVRVKFNY